jgi:hypothetical protein
MIESCPFDNCFYEGTLEDLDAHIAYMIIMDDSDHQEPENRLTWIRRVRKEQ